MWARLLSAALGLWLMAAPHVLDYGGAVRVNDRVMGPLVASLGVLAAWEVARELRWSSLVFGLWLLVAPWVLKAPVAAIVNEMTVGLCLIALALVRGQVRERFGGGWSSLMRTFPEPGS